MSALVRYSYAKGIGWIDLDDGKVNVMTCQMQDEIAAAFEQAERDNAVVVVRGRPGVFSAGFDLNVLKEGAQESADMVIGGFELAYTVMKHPRPVVMACTGHAIAMGVFLLMAGDYRIGINGTSKLTANEVAIGLTLPHAATELLRHRMTPSGFQRSALLAETFSSRSAAEVGILDEVCPKELFEDRVAEIAGSLAALDEDAQTSTKRRTREPSLHALAAAIARDQSEFDQQLTSTGIR